ncbi:MAG: cytochrome c [Pseudomonadota bacterium]
MWRLRSLGAIALLGIAVASCSAMRPAERAANSGQELFQRHCASCHGETAQGHGPVAPFSTVAVPDLTRIAERRGGGFPALEIFRIIDGQAPLAAHGPRHMPVWGYEFFGEDSDDRIAHQQATERVDRLVQYLASIQRAPHP